MNEDRAKNINFILDTALVITNQTPGIPSPYLRFLINRIPILGLRGYGTHTFNIIRCCEIWTKVATWVAPSGWRIRTLTFSGALEVEDSADDAAILLEDHGVLPPHIGGGQNQAAVVRQDVRERSSNQTIYQSNLVFFC